MDDVMLEGGKSTSKSIASDVYIGVKSWYKKLDPTGDKLEGYREGINHALNKVQIMGMDSHKQISDIYIALRVHSNMRKLSSDKPADKYIYDKDNPESSLLLDNENAFDIDGSLRSLGYGHIPESLKRLGKSSEAKSVEDLSINDGLTNHVYHGKEAFSFVDGEEKVLVLGQPGCGKTTFLKSLALAYSHVFKPDVELGFLIPIFVRLRDFYIDGVGSSDLFLKFILEAVSELSSVSFIDNWMQQKIEKGQCVFLIDGVDELSDEQSKNVLNCFRKFVNKYHKNKFVVTCRTSAYEHGLEGFKICEVDDFNDKDLGAFISQWFGDQVKTRKTLANDLKTSLIARDLCKTPLLATMICLMYQYNKRIPNNRFELYESCLDALMYRWDSFRSIDRSRKITSISDNAKKAILAKVARTTFDDDKLYVRKNYLLSLLSKEIDRLSLKISSSELLYDYESNMGILVETDVNLYTFSHLTFHEYFTALHYLELRNENQIIDKALGGHKYKEVLLLIMEKTLDADRLGLILIGRIKSEVISTGLSNSYVEGLIQDVLRSSVLFDKRVRAALHEVYSELMSLPDPFDVYDDDFL
ncbi:NACHT domain-containing protein [Endozoicomonas elysicola]|uniref:NACHT domain-containing protein n=1 Tax=Endozoicomonas elysicola TaxID=305900 RepID=A0A081KB98_9GAMM|nr:NACHT domain-containing protein [Endozoicomonas elysicola]KEI71424.1 hypothetical protein GV64_12340 [Endozoicomonas elysicola]